MFSPFSPSARTTYYYVVSVGFPQWWSHGHGGMGGIFGLVTRACSSPLYHCYQIWQVQEDTVMHAGRGRLGRFCYLSDLYSVLYFCSFLSMSPTPSFFLLLFLKQRQSCEREDAGEKRQETTQSKALNDKQERNAREVYHDLLY
jgi:hypothetical protein